MGVSKYTFDEKADKILDFLRDNICSQGELARQLMFELGYESEMAARVSIGKLLEQMRDQGMVYFKEQKSKRGYIPTKVWYIKKDGLQDISGKEQEA